MRVVFQKRVLRTAGQRNSPGDPLIPASGKVAVLTQPSPPVLPRPTRAQEIGCSQAKIKRSRRGGEIGTTEAMAERDSSCPKLCCAEGCSKPANSSPRKKAKTCLHSSAKGRRWQEKGMIKVDAEAHCFHNGDHCFVGCGTKECLQRMKSHTRPVSRVSAIHQPHASAAVE